jgi:WD40 repeat protein
VNGNVVAISPADGSEPVLVEAKEGTHLLTVTKGGFETKTEHFTIRSGKGDPIDVRLVPKEGDVAGQPPMVDPVAAADPPAAISAVPHKEILGPTLKELPPDPDLPGLIPNPKALPGIGRWQVQTVMPSSDVFCVDWSPTGEYIACASKDGSIRIYDPDTLEVVRMLLGHEDEVKTVVWDGEGKRLASASRDGTARIWSADGQLLNTLVEPTGAQMLSVAWSPDEKQVVTGSDGNAVRVWEANGTPFALLEGHTGYHILDVDWSPDGQWIASAGDDNTIRLWDTKGDAGAVIHVSHHSGRLAWHPEGKILAAMNSGKSLVFYSPDGTFIRELDSRGVFPVSLDWTRDGRRLAVAGDLTSPQIWRADGTRAPDILKESGYRQHQFVSWSPDGDRVATAGTHGIDVTASDGKILASRHTKSRGQDSELSWAPDGSWLAVTPSGDAIGFETSDVPKALDSEFGEHSFVGDWSPDGRWMPSGLRSGSIRLLDPDGEPGASLSADFATALSWNPDSTKIAAAYPHKLLRVWDINGELELTLKGHEQPVIAVSWSPDGRWIASGSVDKTVRLWHPDGTPHATLKHGNLEAAKCLAWSPDSKLLASAWYPHKVVVWNSEGVLQLVRGNHKTASNSVEWHPNGQWLASAGGKTVRLWKPDGTPGPVLRPWGAEVLTAKWSPDGRRLAAGTAEHVVTFYNGETFEPEQVSIVLHPGKTVSFSPTGDILHGDPELIEKELVYLIEQENGVLEVLKPSEFEKRVAEAE